ncbi:MAG: hypothetical protein LUI13_00830 [Lachnospiraceae bacterium]|nr:hypothetical protein [Lachnospiraceae bacterium]
MKESENFNLAEMEIRNFRTERFEAEVRETYRQAEELIKQDLYEEADEKLEQIRGLQYTELEIDKLLSLCEAHMSYDDGDLTSAYETVSSLEMEYAGSAIQTELDAFKAQVSEEYDLYLEEKAIAESEAQVQREKEAAERAAEKEKSFLESLKKKVPYVGLAEEYIGKTALGAPSSTVRHNTEMVNGKAYTANLYDFKSGNKTIFTARCVQGEVIQVWDKRNSTSSGSSSSSSSSGSSSKKGLGGSSGSSSGSDEYNASDYDDPEEFYYDHYDDFDGYEDAEVYWEDSQ